MDHDARFQRLIDEGLAASQDHRRQDALDLFAQASEVLPSSEIPHFLIGSEHAAAGEVEAAEAAFATAVLLAPGFTLARYQLGLLQFSSGRAAVALVTWEPLFSLPRDRSLGRFACGFAALAQDRFQEALEQLEAGLACEDTNRAVASDVLQVTDAVKRLISPLEPPPETSDSHVLLAAYGRGLH